MDIVLFLFLGLGIFFSYFGSDKIKPLARVFMRRWGIGLGLTLFAVILGDVLMPNGRDDEEVIPMLFVGALVLAGMTTMIWAFLGFGLQFYALKSRK